MRKKTPCRRRVLLVDDHPLVREGLALLISAQDDLEVCGEAATCREALELVQETGPDLAVVDLSLKDGHGIELIRRISAQHAAIAILVLSAHDESVYAERALRAGALGYLSKQQSQNQVMIALRTVLAGRRYLSPAMNQRLVGRALGDRDPLRSPMEDLSNRELQVFERIGRGQTTGAIARELHLSVHTIDTHRESIKRKLGLANSGELTQHAVAWVLEDI